MKRLAIGDDWLRERVRSHHPLFDHNNYQEEEMNVRNIRLGIYGGLAGGVSQGANADQRFIHAYRNCMANRGHNVID